PEPRREVEPGAVDEDVDMTMPREDVRAGARDRLFIGDIEHRGFGLAAGSRDKRDAFLDTFRRAAADDHACAGGSELLRAGTADAAARAGQPRHLTRQRAHRRPPLITSHDGGEARGWQSRSPNATRRADVTRARRAGWADEKRGLRCGGFRAALADDLQRVLAAGRDVDGLAIGD